MAACRAYIQFDLCGLGQTTIGFCPTLKYGQDVIVAKDRLALFMDDITHSARATPHRRPAVG